MTSIPASRRQRATTLTPLSCPSSPTLAINTRGTTRSCSLGAEELVRKTPEFWTQFVLPKIINEFWGVHRFLNRPYPDGPNEYMQRVEANIDKVRRQVATAA